MFQFGFGVDSAHAKWFDTIEEVFTIKVKNKGGVCAAVQNPYGTFVSVACESPQKSDVLHEIRECLADMYATVVKHDYLRRSIRLPLNRPSYNLLLHTLVAFDRENEREIIQNNLPICNGMSLDGIFHFRLRELQTRWNEIARLATENAPYLSDEDTLNELIRFLIGAISPKIMRLEVSQQDNRYNVYGRLPESEFEFNIIGTEQLLLYLIDIAPLELKLNGPFTDKRLCDRLVRIFDAKRAETPLESDRRSKR